MSVPVRYSATSGILDNNNSIDDQSEAQEEMRLQRIPIGVRLGTPDAAATVPLGNTDDNVSVLLNPSTEELFAKLNETLMLEIKFQPCLYLPQEAQNGEVTIGARDGAAHVLRCLKVWYDLPSDVLFAAINLVDRFLTKMKVRPKHIACISVGSFHLAIKQLGLPQIDTEDLVAISQCRCTSGDLERMAGIIGNKLGVQLDSPPITSLSCLRLFYYILKNAAHEMGLGQFYDTTMSLHELEMRLEILTCDAKCASIRASELALVLICTQLDVNVSKCFGEMSEQIQGLINYAIEMQKFCRIPEGSLFESHSVVVDILSRYNAQHKMPYRQRLVWKLSSRTMRLLRPTNKLTSYLPTIVEHNNPSTSKNLHRSRTGSVSSEEGEDWPTSPVVPVYEQC